MLLTPTFAAKNPDKPARIEKVERKLERAALAEIEPAPAPRQIIAAPAAPPERSSRSDRSSKSERPSTSDARPAAPPSPADPKFDGFRIITERNIFNPNRVGRSRTTPEEKPPRVDTIALVGTMEYANNLIAFFDSPDAAFRKTLREGQSVGDFTVRRISSDGVELERDGQPVALKVAQQLRRVEGGDWSVSAAEPPASGSETANDSRPAPPAIPANASETLRRLMEQRQKQLKQ